MSLFQKIFQDNDELTLDHCNVYLTYKDTDGDSTLIHSVEDLAAALEEYRDEGKMKILAHVQLLPRAVTVRPTKYAAAKVAKYSDYVLIASSHDDSTECSDDDSLSGSDDDDEPFHIFVQGAGCPVVNGIYFKNGSIGKSITYTKAGKLNGMDATFHVLQSRLSTHAKRWFITAVLTGDEPGTDTYIDFYRAEVTKSCLRKPPQTGWLRLQVSFGGSPTVFFV